METLIFVPERGKKKTGEKADLFNINVGWVVFFLQFMNV